MVLVRNTFAVLLLIWPVLLTAQQADSTSIRVQKDLEIAFEEIDEESGVDTEQLGQLLQDLTRNPLNLNTATVEELLQIPGVSLKTAAAILNYRTDIKPFESVEELTKVRGIGKVAASRIAPYVSAGPPPLKNRELLFNRRYWMDGFGVDVITRYQSTVQDQQGYQTVEDGQTRYVGTPGRYYQRFTVDSRHISLNLTQEKDAGEELSYPTSFNFNSWHAAIQDVGVVKNVVVGDFSAAYGLGLVLYNGGAFGKGREVIGAAARSDRGIRPYRSAEENLFFRGVGATVGDKLQVSALYSNRRWSASEAGEDSVFFPNYSGLYRTESELSRRDNLGVQTLAGRVKYRADRWQIGTSAYQAAFDKTITARTGIGDLYDFRGKESSSVGLDFKVILDEIQLYGEAARSRNGAYAALTGMDIDLGKGTEFSLTYRNFAKNYQTLFGAAFSESSGLPQNEEGLYLGFQQQINDRLSLRAYADQYRFPSQRTGISRPGSGLDLLGNVDFQWNRQTEGYILVRHEVKDADFSSTDPLGRELNILGEQLRQSIRLHIEHQISRQFRWRSRIEGAYFRAPGEQGEYGMLLYQDVRFIVNKRLQFDARLTFFDTESFDTRVYQFENDLLFVMTNAALSGRGQRYYLLMKYNPIENLDLWLKFDSTIFDDRSSIGSGLDEIQGNVRSRIGVQARYNF